MNTRHDSADGPEDIDKAFAEIVAELERDAPQSAWAVDDVADGSVGDSADGSSVDDSVDGKATNDRSAPTESSASERQAFLQSSEPTGPRDWAPEESSGDEEHYEPPEPPPLPAMKAGTIGGIVVIITGLALLVVPAFASWLGTFALAAGLIAISAGIGWLLLRMRQAPPESEGWDDGAQV